MVMDTYALEKLTGWTPELSPPPDSPFYRWRVLAGDLGTLRGSQGFAIAAWFNNHSSLSRFRLASSNSFRFDKEIVDRGRIALFLPRFQK
jgi:hypothetical protein